MQRKENFLPFFIVFFVLSLFLILLGESGLISSLSSLANKSVSPVRNATFGILTLSNLKNKTIESLNQENQSLRKQLVDRQNLVSENKALKDQFAKSSSNSQSLLPAKVVGLPGFIPGVSLPDYIVIDKGSSDGIMTGNTVVIGNYLVGKVTRVTPEFSKIGLVSNKSSSFTARISDPTEEITGILKGKGESEMILDNVLLTQTLKKDIEVLTYGEQDETGKGYPPGLIVGKIISIEKKSTDLFQRADVKSYLDFTNLEMVFVVR